MDPDANIVTINNVYNKCSNCVDNIVMLEVRKFYFTLLYKVLHVSFIKLCNVKKQDPSRVSDS